MNLETRCGFTMKFACRRKQSRLGALKAITATAHKLGRILYNLMRYGLAYVQQEEAVYAKQVQERLEKQLHRRAKELGFEVVKVSSGESRVQLPGCRRNRLPIPSPTADPAWEPRPPTHKTRGRVSCCFTRPRMTHCQSALFVQTGDLTVRRSPWPWPAVLLASSAP